MHLVGFIIRIYHDARSSECQISCFVTPVRDLSRPVLTTIHKVIKLSVPMHKPILRALILSVLYRALNSVIYLYYGAMIYKQSTTTRKFAMNFGNKTTTLLHFVVHTILPAPRPQISPFPELSWHLFSCRFAVQ